MEGDHHTGTPSKLLRITGPLRKDISCSIGIPPPTTNRIALVNLILRRIAKAFATAISECKLTGREGSGRVLKNLLGIFPSLLVTVLSRLPFEADIGGPVLDRQRLIQCGIKTES
mmetsp:Transcript_4749/g.6199  ORF Transcript_4749/g.6199 Transcript_4749/m.6199 type:complete len:115 (+) Transcript_4749:558-902(+)